MSILSSNTWFISACSRGDLKAVQEIMLNLHSINQSSIFEGSRLAARNGHIPIIEALLHVIDSLDDLLHDACLKNQLRLVDWLILKGANNFNIGLRGATGGGHIEMAKYMVSKGAMDYVSALNRACFHGDMPIIQFLIDKGANNWNSGLVGAAVNNQIDVMKLMISKGASSIDYALYRATFQGKFQAVKFLLDYKPGNIERCAELAYDVKHTDILNLLLIEFGKIPDEITTLTEEQVYYLFKNNVKPSETFEDQYDKLYMKSHTAAVALSGMVIPDIVNMINTY